MEETAEHKTCLSCGKKLKGRIDKKFCDDYCRNAYNNQLKSKHLLSPAVRNVQNALLKNRRLLEQIVKPGEEMGRISRAKLLDMGFQFKYHTHIYTNKKQQDYFFVFDYGWLAIDGDYILVVHRA